MRPLHNRNYWYEASAGFNSITLKNKGRRTIHFSNGQRIDYNFAYEVYSGTIMGSMKVEVHQAILPRLSEEAYSNRTTGWLLK